MAQKHYDGEFPFTRPSESDASMFIQWKGTDVCVDFICECGEHGHFDGGFMYYLQCPTCESIYTMGTQVVVKKVGPDFEENIDVQVMAIN